MDKNQIIRIPIKYWELIDTMSNEEWGKLFKAIMSWSSENLEWLTETYYNIINVDIINLFNAVSNWKKGGRPKKEKGGLWNKKGGLLKIVTNISKEKIREDKVNKENKDIEYFSHIWLNDIFLEFIKHRKQNKSNMTDRAITLLKNKVDKLLNKNTEDSIIDLFENSILNNRKTIYPDSIKKENKKYDFSTMNKNELADLRNETNWKIQPELRKYNIYLNAEVEAIANLKK